MSTIRLPFRDGTAAIVTVCAPLGRYPGSTRYEIRKPICRANLFRDGELSEQANFFGRSHVVPWIGATLGPLQAGELPRQAGESEAQWRRRWADTLAVLDHRPFGPEASSRQCER